MNTDQGRISEILSKTRICTNNENLARARKYIGNGYYPPTKVSNKEVITESAYLTTNVNTTCYNYVKTPVVPESVRINRLIQNTLEKEYDQTNVNTRFAAYAPTPVIVACGPLDPNVFNGYLPKVSRICRALPNTPMNPVLPI